MNINELMKSSFLLIFCIFLSRFIMPPSYTPIIAMAIFMPLMSNNKMMQLFLPVSILLLSDLLLGFYGQTMLFVYGSMILIGLLARKINDGSLGSLLKSSISSVILWHLIVNFGVYLNGLGTKTLAQTYALAIPFDFRLLLSTLFFSLVFYSALQLSKRTYSLKTSD